MLLPGSLTPELPATSAKLGRASFDSLWQQTSVNFRMSTGLWVLSYYLVQTAGK